MGTDSSPHACFWLVEFSFICGCVKNSPAAALFWRINYVKGEVVELLLKLKELQNTGYLF